MVKKIRLILSAWLDRVTDVATPMAVLVVAIGLQLGVMLVHIIESEWTLHYGEMIKLAIDPIDPFDPFRGAYFEFIPQVFRHSFPSRQPMSVGDQVIVVAVDPKRTQWAISADRPRSNQPYFRLTIKSANGNNFFIAPPFRRVILDDESKQIVKEAFGNGRSPKHGAIYLLVRQRGDHAMIQGIQVGNRVIEQN